MIIEHTYDDRRICRNCSYLKLDADGWMGECQCKDNRVKARYRCVTDRKCTYKRMVIQ